jgi:hypothetical protein
VRCLREEKVEEVEAKLKGLIDVEVEKLLEE